MSPSVRPIGFNHSNLLELRLMHHYTSMTCGRQSSRTRESIGPSLANLAWEVDIPQIAFTSDVVLNGLLAISALNLLSMNPGDPIVAAASIRYFDKAIVKQRALLGHINSQNAEPLLLTSVLILHFNWLSAHNGKSQEPYKFDLSTYHLCQGAKSVAHKVAPWTGKYEFRSVDKKNEQDGIQQDMSFLESALNDMNTLLNNFNDKRIGRMEMDTYEKTADDIMGSYSVIASEHFDESALEQRIVTILHRIPPSFIHLLEDNNPIAIALYSRNIVLLSMLENSSSWWIHGAGEDKVCSRSIYGFYSLLPSKFRWIMDWPLKILSKEIIINHAKSTVSAKVDHFSKDQRHEG
jgi:hypothetical protein